MRPRSVSPLLCVTDLDRSIDFYGRLGFEAEVRWETYARLRSPDAGTLHLAVPGDPPPDRPTVAMTAPPAASPGAASMLLVVEVDDCVQAAEHLRASGVTLVGGPGQPPWGGEIRAFLHDPDGHLVELNQPLE